MRSGTTRRTRGRSENRHLSILIAVVSICEINFRYLLDLYTLTFDEDETVDEIKVLHTVEMRYEVQVFCPIEN